MIPGLVVAHLAFAAAMTGLIWFVELVHYPLFDRVARDGFTAFEAQHQRRTGWVVMPLMLGEAAAAIALLVARPAQVPALAAWLGAGLLAVAWIVTWTSSMPAHLKLLQGWDERAHASLMRGNHVRTAAWTLRALLAAWMAWRVASA